MQEDEKRKLLAKAKELEGKTLGYIANLISNRITDADERSRVLTKSAVGYLVEQYFGVSKNPSKSPDIEYLKIELKTSPLKYLKTKELRSKEALSLNIINYVEEAKSEGIKTSSLYAKNKEILFVFYLHDKDIPRSEYTIKHVFYWEMDDQVCDELEPDYQKILKKIRNGKAHQIREREHDYLTLCPKHSGKFNDPNCKKSKRKQPYSKEPAETRAFRLKHRYMNLILERYISGKREARID